MHSSDSISARFFTQSIDFCPHGDPVFAGVRFDAPLAARLTGAIDGAVVTLDIDDTPKATFTVTHPLLAQPAERILTLSPTGALILTNNDLSLTETGTGLGVRILAHQVYAARSIGVTTIDLWAGAGIDQGRPLNGTWTWARCGFDGPLPWTYEAAKKKLSLQVPRMFSGFKIADHEKRVAWLKAWPLDLKDATRIQDLMTTEHGRRWWKACPVGCEMAFDLTKGSTSWRVLEAYLQEKEVDIGAAAQGVPLTSPAELKDEKR